ncbi:TIGR03943 family putative permease subunit [Paenibacillus sp. NPDC056579]|uniref:TIGR03943 family putative permease subunit n=1 Tax=Paenibacillus sp. NPDC056579 TaxID=3345871 RepID=UPI0036BE2757
MKIGSVFAHRLVRALILLAFVLFIVQLGRSDALIYYVAPRMDLWVKGLALGMYMLAMHQLYLAVRDVSRKKASVSCSCSSHSHDQWKPGVVVMYGALIIPLVLAFSMPDAVLGSQMATKKGLNLTPSSILVNADNVTGDTGTSGTMFPSNDYTKPYAKQAADMYSQPLIMINDDIYIESLTSMDLYQEQFLGKKVQIAGYVYRLDSMKENQFAVGRFAMRCCVADSVPMAIMVEADNPKQWNNDMFVVVLGTIEQRNIDGKSVLTIAAKSIETQQVPTSPYVYGNPYFGS